MSPLEATVTIRKRETQILVKSEDRWLLRARLPTLSGTAHPPALLLLLESVALWCGQPLRTVVFVDESLRLCDSGLDDGLGRGFASPLLRAEIVPLEHEDRPHTGDRLGHGGWR